MVLAYTTAKDVNFLYMGNEESDQTARMSEGMFTNIAAYIHVAAEMIYKCIVILTLKSYYLMFRDVCLQISHDNNVCDESCLRRARVDFCETFPTSNTCSVLTVWSAQRIDTQEMPQLRSIVFQKHQRRRTEEETMTKRTSRMKPPTHEQRRTGVVGWGKDVVYLTSSGRPTEIGLQLDCLAADKGRGECFYFFCFFTALTGLMI